MWQNCRIGLLSLSLFGLSGCSARTPSALATMAGTPVASPPASAAIAASPTKPTAAPLSSGSLPKATAAVPLAAAPFPGAVLPTLAAAAAPLGSASLSAGPSVAYSTVPGSAPGIVPGAAPAPIVIPKATGPMAPLVMDAGKTIPIIVPKTVEINKLHKGSTFRVVVDDDGTPFSSGADAAMEKGVQLEATVVNVGKGYVQFLFDKAIDGAGNSYPLIGGLTTRSGGGLPQWLRDAEVARTHKADQRLDSMRNKLSESHERDRDAAEQHRSHEAERRGDWKNMSVILPWAAGSKGLLIAAASYVVGKTTDQMRTQTETSIQSGLDQRENERKLQQRSAEDEEMHNLATERLNDAVSAGSSTLHSDMARGTRAGVTLTFVFSSKKSIEQMNEEMNP